MNGYLASRSWYRFVEENKQKIKPIHSAVIHWCYSVANDLRWPKSFQLPTVEACEMIGITDRETFHKALKDLVSFGALRIDQESTGRYVARWISLDLPDFYRPIFSEGYTEGIGEGTTEGTTTKVNSNKENKESKEEYKVVFDENGIAKCQVLRTDCVKFRKDHPGKYPDSMFTEFLTYWSEPNERSVPRWHSEKKKKGRFHLAARLATWHRNNFGKMRHPLTPPLVPQVNIPDRLKTHVL